MANSKAQQDETAIRRLDSWKEIAQYLGRDITTVMRWERERRLPVHRVPGKAKRQTVYAISREIDNWLSGAGVRNSELGDGEPGKGHGGSRLGAGETEGSKQDAHGEGRPLGSSAHSIPRDWHDSEMPGVKPGATFRPKYFGHWLLAGCVSVALAVVYILARSNAVPKVLAYHQLTNDGRLKDNAIVTDGARVYFTELTPSGRIVAEVPAGGGQVSTLSTVFDHPSLQSLSRSRSEILILDPYGVVSKPRLWAMPLSGNSPRRVGDVMADSAAWAPDGNSIVYAAGHNIFLCNLDGSESRKLATLPGPASAIHWSPDGSVLRISLRAADRESDEIWEVRADGSNPHPLLPNWRGQFSQANGQWTPDGKYFLFVSRDNSGWTNLWALSEKKGILAPKPPSPVEVTAGPLALEDWVPSPERNRAFTLEGGQRFEVLRYDRGRGQFVPYLRGVSAEYLDFTQDGESVVYVRPPDSTLWKSRPDGTRAVQLTFPFTQIELPQWSPDGNSIAFMGVKGAKESWRVNVIPAGGGESHLVLPSTIAQGAPTWSPDSKRVAFGDLPEPGGAFPVSATIHIVDLATHTATTLPGSDGLWTARWSPDGRHMAAVTTDAKSLKIFDFHTGRWQVAATAGCINDLRWSHRGDAVYFLDLLPPSNPVVYRVRLQDNKVEKVASLTGSNPISSNWLGLTPDDSILVSNSAGTSEIYALDMEWP